MTERKVLFRLDAGALIGFGHLRRSLSLAEALALSGWECAFLTNDIGGAWNDLRGKHIAKVTSLRNPPWSEGDASEVLKTAGELGFPMVVVDSDHAGEQYLRGLRDAGLIVCVIDDLASHPFPVHLVINGDAHAEALPYLSSTGDTRFLTGPKYAILRSEFWQVPVPERSREVQTVLLTLGGGDPSNLMPRLITHLGTHFRELSLVVIQGPFFENGVEIKRAADCFPGDVEILSAPSSVVSAMLEADVAISSGGQTLYELARVGCPTIAIGAADNQTAQMESLANFGAIQIAGRIQDPSIVEMCTRRLVTLAEGSDARRRMSVAGRSLVDGGGALRVVRALEDLTQSTSFSPTKNGVA